MSDQTAETLARAEVSRLLDPVREALTNLNAWAYAGGMSDAANPYVGPAMVALRQLEADYVSLRALIIGESDTIDERDEAWSAWRALKSECDALRAKLAEVAYTTPYATPTIHRDADGRLTLEWPEDGRFALCAREVVEEFVSTKNQLVEAEDIIREAYDGWVGEEAELIEPEHLRETDHMDRWAHRACAFLGPRED